MSSPEKNSARQDQALMEIMSSYRYEMTDFEARTWGRIIDSVPEERFLGFLSHHFATSPFAPKPSDASKALDLILDPSVAYGVLSKFVQEVGPYNTPGGMDPLLVSTVQFLGGWEAVNRDMPDASDSFKAKSFRERFDACFNQAVAKVRINNELPQTPLRAIGHSSAAALPAPAAKANITYIERPKA